MGYIYKITNKINNQCYIGQTTNLEERWRKHKTTRSKCRYLKNAFNKYGIENFEFKLICVCFDCDLNRFEINYIEKYDCLVPKGYNLRAGGENGGKHNNETKIKISNSLKKKYSESPKLHSKPSLGKPHTEEIKNKISKALKGIKKTPETIEKMKLSTKFKVYKIDKEFGFIIEEFNGYPEAAKSVDTTKNSIWRACNGKTKTCKNFIWKSEIKNL